ncbi:MAG: tyrosine-protein phosphatase [Kiritimatiellia bacterium]
MSIEGRFPGRSESRPTIYAYAETRPELDGLLKVRYTDRTVDARNYPILVHCSAGADRTGSLAFVLNGLLGVEEDELWKDWEVNTFWDTNMDFRHAGRCEALSRDFNALPGATFADKCEAYVLACGFTKEDVAWFREQLLTRRDGDK